MINVNDDLKDICERKWRNKRDEIERIQSYIADLQLKTESYEGSQSFNRVWQKYRSQKWLVISWCILTLPEVEEEEPRASERIKFRHTIIDDWPLILFTLLFPLSFPCCSLEERIFYGSLCFYVLISCFFVCMFFHSKSLDNHTPLMYSFAEFLTRQSRDHNLDSEPRLKMHLSTFFEC